MKLKLEGKIKVKRKINLLFIAPYSSKLKGAEEKDIEAGLNILYKLKDVKVYSAFIDLHTKKVHVSIPNFNPNFKSGKVDKIRYLIKYFTSPDHALREGYTFKNYILIDRICKSYEIDIIYTNTTCTLLFGMRREVCHIHRSVSFEPLYSLKSVRNLLKAVIHSLLKITTVIKELRADTLVSISPKDKYYYNIMKLLFLRKTNLVTLPLRQFYLSSSKIKKLGSLNNLNIAFLGSTFNVLHNLKALNFILKNINEDFLKEIHGKLNLYGSKFPPEIKSSGYINRNDWVVRIEDIYKKNQCFLVPYFLNSGMQSKVFEPLLAGSILICDPRTISWPEFLPYVHYIPAKTGLEFRESIKWVRNNPELSSKIAANGMKKSLNLIGPQAISRITREIIYAQSDDKCK